MNQGRLSVTCEQEIPPDKSGKRAGVPEFNVHGSKPIHENRIRAGEIFDHNALISASNEVRIIKPLTENYSA